MRELVSADDDCNQTGHFRYCAGEEVLKSLEAGIKRCPLRMSCQRDDEKDSQWREERTCTSNYSPLFE